MRHNKNKLTISLFLLIILFIGIGYAYLTSNLTLSGSTKLAGNTWDIHFANLVVNSSSVSTSTPATIDPTDNTSIDYEVTLDKPGDFYEFTVDIVNAGSITGKISLLTNTGIPTELKDIIDYSIVYTNKNTPVQVNDLLNHNSSKNIKVKVSFIEDISNNDLPSDDIDLDLNLSITYIQSDADEVTTEDIIEQLKTENSSCFTKYTGQVTDQVGETVTASNVYFNRCEDNRNIIFNNMCWQMIRTTENSGIKMIYNGEPVEGKCLNTRGDHKGIVQSNYDTQTLNSSYLYGESFTYDITNNTFTLTNTESAIWSDTTYENLIGKVTCKTSSDTCTTIYQINGYYDNTTAYSSAYTIGDTNYAQIGSSSYNANRISPAKVGYMFNKVYTYDSINNSAPTSGSLMGNNVSYANGTYTLLPANGESTLGTTLNDTHHYTCNNTTGTCNKVRYYHYSNSTNNYYIELDGEESIDEAVGNMLYSDNVNRYNSSIKGIIDNWYAQKLSLKTNMLEDTVYCNGRNMTNQTSNGWNKNGNMTTKVIFENLPLNKNLACLNITDQFAVSNNKAKLTYPVALATNEELYALTNITYSTYNHELTKTNAQWWGLSPGHFIASGAYVRYVHSTGDVTGTIGVDCTATVTYDADVRYSLGVRPVVALASGALISSGTGSEVDPWIIQE